jgi:prevent-host-death family protein
MVWQVYDAKARFSEFLDATLKDGPQVLTRRGVETAVLVPIDEWKRLKTEARPNIKDVLLDPNGPHDLDIPLRRGLFRLRTPVEFE